MPLISLDGNVNSEAEEMNSTEGDSEDDSEDDSEGDSEGDSKGPDNAMLYKMAAAGYELLDGYGALDALETSTKADPMAEKLEQQRRMHEIVKDHNHVLDRYVYDRLPPRRMAAKVSSRDDEFLMSGEPDYELTLNKSFGDYFRRTFDCNETVRQTDGAATEKGDTYASQYKPSSRHLLQRECTKH